MSEITSFGEWVQARRNQLRYSRTALAKQINCSPVTIKKIERDERRPSVQIAELLATHLQIPEAKRKDFIQRARGQFVARFGLPTEMSFAEAQTSLKEDSPKHNLPPQTTSFIGRDKELAEIAIKLSDPTCRLLTIMGAGGMGKTRLGVEATRGQLNNFTDGILYIALAPVNASTVARNPLVGALADGLNISFHGDDMPEKQLFDFLCRKEMLLVLDNFEHLLKTAVFVADLIQHAPDIKILITSRERLNLQEEWLFPLQGLSFPKVGTTQPGDLDQSALQLFKQRAQQLNPSFDFEDELPAILQICQLVEGMPLALELAAAWVRQLSCKAIAAEIKIKIDFLTSRARNMPERHRSMRALFGYSWQQLSVRERVVLQRLSVFRDGFEREAAKAVANASLQLLLGLVDKSLLVVGENGRYIIHELLRQFAAEKLSESTTEQNEAQNLHCQHFLTLVAALESKITGADILIALNVINKESDNIQTAVDWGIDHQPQMFNKPFAIVMWQFHHIAGRLLKGESMFNRISGKLKHSCNRYHKINESNTVPVACLHWALYNANMGLLQVDLGRLQKAKETLLQSLAILPPEDDTVHWTRSWVLLWLAWGSSHAMNIKHGMAYIEEVDKIAQSTNDPWLYGLTLHIHGTLLGLNGEFAKCRRFLKEGGVVLDGLGEKIWNSNTLADLGRLATLCGDLTAAEAYHRESLSRRNNLGFQTGLTWTLRDLGDVAYLRGNYQVAREYYQQCIAIADEINATFIMANSLWALGNLALAEEKFTVAQQYFQESSRLQPVLWIVGGFGWVALASGQLAEAKRHFCITLQQMIDTGYSRTGLDAIVGFGHLKAQGGQLGHALELLALVQHHPATIYEVKEKAYKLWKELVAELPSEFVAAAQARGRELDLFETAQLLIEEFAS